jgi:Protein of unknown function (DUF3990)
MRVYHGSFIEIIEIDLSKCEKNKDFGQGFYVTKNRWGLLNLWAYPVFENEK